MIKQPSIFAHPYVGPRTFTRAEGNLFFGREREAQDLLALVISQRLVLFYAQSGAGKSSLINTRLIPQLQNAGFAVLPVGRVGGELPAGVTGVANIFLFNLMLSLDQGGTAPQRLAGLTLPDFLARLASEDGKIWHYEPPVPVTDTTETANERGDIYQEPSYVLIIDQFEEIITNHLHRWPERVAFFQALEEAMRRDPKLWVVLTLREDYVAALDPYAQLMTDKLRARFYMERMGVAAALEAIQRPAAEIGGCPFEPGVAETLVDNLRRIKGSDQGPDALGQYVEPVQLQVVCYQLWENLFGSEQAQSAHSKRVTISQDDLARGGDVDTALADFYGDAIKAVLALETLAISERTLRIWFDKYLITEEGTRGTVYRGEETTAGMPNAVVDVLQDRFLLRSELRAGGTWVELVHDRFVEPIRRANSTWRAAYYNPVAAACERWIESGRTDDRLLRDDHLMEAITFATKNPVDIMDEEKDFLQRSQVVAQQRLRQRKLFIGGTVVLLIIFGLLAWYGLNRAISARQYAELALQARATAEINADLAAQQLARLTGLRFYQEAEQLKKQGKIEDAMAAYTQADTSDKTLNIDLEFQKEDVRRQAAILFVGEGEQLARNGNLGDAIIKYQAALNLNPPLDTPLYVPVTAGSVTIGSKDEQIDAAFKICEKEHGPCDYNWFLGERPQTTLEISEFWILRTEVTNWQYAECVEAKICEAPANRVWHKSESRNLPVTYVSWYQAEVYVHWKGGRLPTEAEWEKACRGNDLRSYPWGNEKPTSTLVNWAYKEVTVTAVGSYPEGRSPYGLLDMAGNVWEWTNSHLKDYPYQMADGREDRTEGGVRVLRGGAFSVYSDGIRCPSRMGSDADKPIVNVGFRIISPGF